MGRGAWWAAVHGVAKSQTRLSDFTFTFHFHALEKEMATHSSVLAWRISGMGEPGGLQSMGSQRVGHLLSVESRSIVSNSLQPHGLYSPCHSPGQNTGVDSISLLQGIFPTQGSNSESPTLQADPLPAEPQGKPKNTRVGNLSLLQWIFPTQELNQGLLHCRQIPHQLSHQGSPRILE